MEKEVKVFQAEIKESNEKDLTVTHFISTEKKDRGGDIMRADGMRVRGRPVVLLSHGYSNMGQEPIAKPLSIKKGEFKGNKGIMATTQFYPDELGKRLWEKTTQGYMPSWSIGFIINKKMDLQDEAGNYGRDIKEWELLEYSLVGVPMNPDAQTPGKSQDEIQFKFAQSNEPLSDEYESETKSLGIVPDGTDTTDQKSDDEKKLSIDEKIDLIVVGWKELGDRLDNLSNQVLEGLKASTELMKVLNELPESLKKNQDQSTDNPPDETKEFVSVVRDEEKEEKLVLPMTADEIRQCIKETVTSSVKAGLNRITGHID